MTVAEAFLLHMAKRGLDGDGAAARSAMTAIEEARTARGATGYQGIRNIVLTVVAPGSVNSALEPSRMAAKLDRYRPTARIVLEPWLVEAALLRLEPLQLSRDEQEKVVWATRTPEKRSGRIGGRFCRSCFALALSRTRKLGPFSN
jgi:hypothetical protein